MKYNKHCSVKNVYRKHGVWVIISSYMSVCLTQCDLGPERMPLKGSRASVPPCAKLKKSIRVRRLHPFCWLNTCRPWPTLSSIRLTICEWDTQTIAKKHRLSISEANIVAIWDSVTIKNQSSTTLPLPTRRSRPRFCQFVVVTVTKCQLFSASLDVFQMVAVYRLCRSSACFLYVYARCMHDDILESKRLSGDVYIKTQLLPLSSSMDWSVIYSIWVGNKWIVQLRPSDKHNGLCVSGMNM